MKVSVGSELLGNGRTLYVIPLHRQLELDQLQEALAASPTWADFLLRAPSWAATMVQSSLEESAGDEEEQVDFHEAFDLTAIPGFDEGDFPPFACYQTAGTLPLELVEKYGKWISTVMNGDYLQIAPGRCADLIADLEDAGCEVIIHHSLRPN